MDDFKNAFENLTERFNELSETLNVFIENQNTIDLIDVFDFKSGFDFVEAIQEYEEKEMYNACQALEILFSIEINQFIQSL